MEICPGVLATRMAMRVHFVHRHVHDTVVMLGEGNLPLPRCPQVAPVERLPGDLEVALGLPW